MKELLHDNYSSVYWIMMVRVLKTDYEKVFHSSSCMGVALRLIKCLEKTNVYHGKYVAIITSSVECTACVERK